ncbi:hypothetical protein Taro_047522 [Colocasia esculenta]|uniref:Uncharacterized protein n=1 Tax=Colocasia esculenta TaxID=4460 RepID=A0A843WWD1_COLES|nr:hypothetical protein [Colocasia esculenta]
MKTITQHKMYPGLDLLSTGVLRPVPEQQLRILLTRVQSPYGHYNTQLSWWKQDFLWHLKGGKVYLDSFSVGVTKCIYGLLKLAELDLRESMDISIVVEELEMPGHLDLLLNEWGPTILVMNLEPF